MIELIFYCMLIYGFIVAIEPIILIILTFIRDTWDKYKELDKKRIKNWMDAYHKGEGNYEHQESNDAFDKDLMEADYPDYDKYDDPFYTGDNNEKKH